MQPGSRVLGSKEEGPTDGTEAPIFISWSLGSALETLCLQLTPLLENAFCFVLFCLARRGEGEGEREETLQHCSTTRESLPVEVLPQADLELRPSPLTW